MTSNSTLTLRITSTVALSKDPISFPAIEIGEVTGLEAVSYFLRIDGPNDNIEIPFDAAAFKGLLVTVEQYGDFKISHEQPGHEAINLCYKDKEVIPISPENWYLDSIGKCPAPFPLALVLKYSIGGALVLGVVTGFIVYRCCKPKLKPLTLEPGELSVNRNVVRDPFIARS
jgi:hypothetical protein